MIVKSQGLFQKKFFLNSWDIIYGIMLDLSIFIKILI